MKKIKQIHTEAHGWIYAELHVEKDGYFNGQIIRTPIEPFTVNGEMAEVTWYRHGDMEYNGKYVTAIEYYKN